MTDLDFPVLDAPPAIAPTPVVIAIPLPTLPAVPSIKATVLAQFQAAEVSIVALAAKYRNVAYDVATTKGMREATAARLELREKGRFAVQRAEKAVKADVNDLKRVMADEVDRLVAIVQPVEDAIDAQIKAEEVRKAAAKAERDRIEAERIARHQAGIDKVRGYLARCQGADMTADRISIGIGMLEGVTFGPEWQEFAVTAANEQCQTLDAMRSLHAQAVLREADAALAEARRVEREAEQARQAAENTRLAAELAERQRVLDAQAAAIAANTARIKRLQALVDEIHASATGHERQTAWDISEAIKAVEFLTVGEEVYGDLAPLARSAQASTLATLRAMHAAATAAEELAAASQAQADEAQRADAYAQQHATEAAAAISAEAAADISAEAAADISAEAAADISAEADSPPAVDLLGDPVAQPAGEDNHDLAQCRAALSQALSMLGDLIRAHATPREAMPLFARVSALRDLGGLPCVTPTTAT